VAAGQRTGRRVIGSLARPGGAKGPSISYMEGPFAVPGLALGTAITAAITMSSFV